MDGWYRAQIVSVDDETESCEVRFLDYGGYLSLSTSCLKAVRADFLTLPFQAVECYLANIAPVGKYRAASNRVAYNQIVNTYVNANVIVCTTKR